MPEFSETSLKRLHTCHPNLIRVMNMAIRNGPDFSIICGYRDAMEQQKAFSDRNSLVVFPYSKHNVEPSVAIDIAPFPIDWDNWNRFRILAGYVMGVADTMGLPLIWGGDWNKNYDEGDEKFRDLPHFELFDEV